MKKKLSIVIMAHPERKEWAEELSKKLNAPVVYDRINNIWDTCRRSWLAVDTSAEYGLILQDDSIIANDFIKRAEALLTEDTVYSFYAGKLLATKINRAVQRKESVVYSGMIFNEIAICMPTKYINEMVKYSDVREAKTDQEIAKWARSKRLKICYPIPSLVDHRDGESIFYRNYNRPVSGRPRKAYIFKQ